MTLAILETYYSFPNIDASNNHLEVLLTMEKRGWTFIYRPVVMRSKQSTMNFNVKKTGDREDEKRIILSPNPNTLRCVLEILDEKCLVDFNVDESLCKVLGFNKKIFKAGRHESENLVNILSVNTILIHCDVIEASRLNGIEALFLSRRGTRDKIVSTPLHLIYIPFTLNIIFQMTCWLTDQNGKELDLRGEEVTITFHVKSC